MAFYAIHSQNPKFYINKTPVIIIIIIDTLNFLLKIKERQHQEVKKSMSWKIITPLRKFINLFSKK